MSWQVLLVDDTEAMRVLARCILDLEDDITVVGETGEPYDALELWRTLRPDVVVMDHRMPGLSGLQVAARILLDDPVQPIILFTAHDDDIVNDEADELGVCRVLSKDRYGDLPAAIRECRASLL